jgi:hypothetical protein
VISNPFGTMAALAAIVLGVLGTVIGDGVSQGMSNSLRDSATLVGHLWGMMFATGGLLHLIGLGQGRSTMEIPGLWLMSGGYAFYAITVVAGLGHGGIAAGTISTAMAVGSLVKTKVIMRQAHEVAAHSLDDASGEGEGPR